jgi:hypothetical protein
MEKSRNKFVRDKATKKYLYLHKNLNPTDAEKEALKKALLNGLPYMFLRLKDHENK